MDISKFIKTVIATLSTEVGIKALTFITTIIIVRNLSAADFGIYSLVISFSFTLCYLSSVGIPQSIIYFVGKRTEELNIIFSTTLFLYVFCGISVFVLGSIFKEYPLHSFLKDVPREYFLPLLILYIFTLLDTFLLSLVRGLKDFLLFNFRRLLTPACNLIGIVLLLVLSDFRLRSCLLIFLTATIVSTIWTFWKVIPIGFLSSAIKWQPVNAFLRYGVKSYIQLIVGHFVYQIDIYIIAYLLGAKQVAYYTIAVGIASLLWFLPDTIGLVLFPTLASIHDETDIHSFTARICRNNLLLVGIASILLGFIGKYLIEIFYGIEYLQSFYAMLLILPGIVGMSIYKILARNFSSRNRQQISIFAGAISLIMNIVLNFLWIPRYGIEGAAFASTVSYCLAGMILLMKTKSESGLPLGKFLLIETQDIGAYGELVSKFCKRFSKTAA